MIKFAIVSDIHSERLTQNKFDDYKKYVKDFILRSTDVKALIFAGDTINSCNVKVDSEEFMNIVSLIDEVATVCKECSMDFIILKGTPSHDGEVIEKIHTILKDKFIYINKNTLTSEYCGLRILFMPEPYYPTRDAFMADIAGMVINSKPDVVIFHGMFDFAIRALRQQDSNFSLNRSIVIESKDFRKFFKYLAIGGHVHDYINDNDIVYSNTCFVPDGKVNRRDSVGIKVVTINKELDTYNITNVPYDLYDGVTEVIVDLTKLHVFEALELVKENDPKYKYIFITDSKSSDDKYLEVEKAKAMVYYVKKRKKDTATNDSVERSRRALSEEDVEVILKRIYKDEYDECLDESYISDLENV